MDPELGFEDMVDIDTLLADVDVDFEDDALTLPEDDIFEE